MVSVTIAAWSRRQVSCGGMALVLTESSPARAGTRLAVHDQRTADCRGADRRRGNGHRAGVRDEPGVTWAVMAASPGGRGRSGPASRAACSSDVWCAGNFPVCVSEGDSVPARGGTSPKRGIHHRVRANTAKDEPGPHSADEQRRQHRPARPVQACDLRKRRGRPAGTDRRPGPDRGSRITTLNHQGSTATASRCCPAVPAPQPQPR